MRILSNSIAGHVPFLYNRPNFFFEPPLGNGQGEGGQANQQQQQQNNTPADPWAGVDLDELPDHVRSAVQQSRQTLQSLQSQSQTASQHQSRADQLQAQLEQLQRQGQQQQTQPRDANQPQTQQERLEAYYVKNGIGPDQAKTLAKINAGAFEIVAQDIQQGLQQGMLPIASKVIETNVRDVWQQITQEDQLGIFENQEVSQKLWDKMNEMATQGQLVDRNLAANLAKIYYVDHLQAGGEMPQNIVNLNHNNPPPQNFHQAPMLQNNQQQQQTRMTYPGAVSSRQPNRSSNPSMDSDTAAAVAATTGHWSPELQAALNKKRTGTR